MKNIVLSGFSDEIHEDFNIQLQSIKQLGLKFIEIRGINGNSITSLSIEKIRKIKDILDKNQISVSALASPIGKILITESFSKHFELFKHCLKIAEILETKYIRMFSFYIPNKEYRKYKEEVMKRLMMMRDEAKSYDIMLLHENEKEIYGDSPKRCLEILEVMNNSNFKAIFDFANFIQCGFNPYDAYEILKPYVVYFHIKDALFKDKTVVPPGLGDGDISLILEKALSNGYQGYLSLEPHLFEFKGLQSLELSQKKRDKVGTNGYQQFNSALKHLKTILDQLEVSYE